MKKVLFALFSFTLMMLSFGVNAEPLEGLSFDTDDSFHILVLGSDVPAKAFEETIPVDIVPTRAHLKVFKPSSEHSLNIAIVLFEPETAKHIRGLYNTEVGWSYS